MVADAPRPGTTAAVSGTARAATGAGMVTAAASFVFLAVATAASVYAEEQRRKAMEKVTELLEELTADDLDAERDRLNGATTAVERATALLLDKGEAGHSPGLDAAVHTVDTAIARPHPGPAHGRRNSLCSLQIASRRCCRTSSEAWTNSRASCRRSLSTWRNSDSGLPPGASRTAY